MATSPRRPLPLPQTHPPFLTWLGWHSGVYLRRGWKRGSWITLKSTFLKTTELPAPHQGMRDEKGAFVESSSIDVRMHFAGYSFHCAVSIYLRHTTDTFTTLFTSTPQSPLQQPTQQRPSTLVAMRTNCPRDPPNTLAPINFFFPFPFLCSFYFLLFSLFPAG